MPEAHTWVGHVNGGMVEDGLSDGFIQNELIDGASDEINDEMQQLMEINWQAEDSHE